MAGVSRTGADIEARASDESGGRYRFEHELARVKLLGKHRLAAAEHLRQLFSGSIEVSQTYFRCRR